MTLADLAHIQPGLPFRSRIETEAGGEFVVIQARDLGTDGLVRVEGAARLHSLLWKLAPTSSSSTRAVISSRARTKISSSTSTSGRLSRHIAREKMSSAMRAQYRSTRSRR